MRLVLLCTALTLAGNGYAEDCAPRALVEGYDDAWTATHVIPWQPQYSSAPSWNVEQGEPPLSISAAVRNALEWERKKTGRNDIGILSVSLHSAGCPDKWVYWIHFKPVAGGDMPDPSMVVVLMDGTVAGERVPVKK